VRLFFWNVVLTVLWVTTTENFSGANWGLGYVLGFVILLILRRLFPGANYFRIVLGVAEFAIFFMKELIIANFRVAKHTLGPLRRLRPGVIEVPLAEGITDPEITTLANLITLTPGTMSLDVSPDRKRLFVHVIDLEDHDAAVRDIKEQFERRVLRTFRWMH
jgi:multicomponent Na+:H+ antiporter subunit E